MIQSIFYLISFIALFSGLLLVRKSESKQALLCWGSVSFIATMGCGALFAALYQLLHIPISNGTIAILNLALAIFFWYKIKKDKKMQFYEIKLYDIIFALLLLVVVAVLAQYQFSSFSLMRYASVDPSTHYIFAMDIVNSGQVKEMFFQQFNNAMFIETFGIFFPQQFDYYRLFLFADAAMLYLAGLMFYALVRKFCKNIYLKVIVIAFVFGYLLGYPWNNMIHGFIYYGVGVSIVAFVIFILEFILREQEVPKLLYALLALGIFAITICYLLFLPVVLLGVAICLSIFLFRQKKLFRIKTVGIYILIFVIPCVLGLIFSFGDLFAQRNIAVSDAITNEGGVYRSLLANFISLMPLVVYSVAKAFKHKKISPAVVLFLLQVIFIGCFLILTLKGKISTYYYYKNYGFLSLTYWYLAIYGVIYLMEKSKLFVASYFLTWLLMAGINFTNIEARFHAINPLLATTPRTSETFDIYNHNMHMVRALGPKVSEAEMEAFRYIANIKDGNYRYLVCDAEKINWYNAMTNQRAPEGDLKDAMNANDPLIMQKFLEDESILELVIHKKYEQTQPYFQKLKAWNVVFENEEVLIVRRP